ncbi:3-oxoacyl-[acyl-carrier-protein] reductase [Butyrivibrio sp. YAB3001]|uniref:3-oxoacyl-[acyl-carrier-protein] reductase n=1 Tax=Butyrivibrio sp. YAB3001 TaxID=1520812 RepID=UPI0008F67938|nr:3-oxoacyl-[acyl-carrier-protein] reductase [Butyrivibrio sp. YAB3001]SFB97173.1 3-oxoacyl-[acyl-carrier-protein] reductase [Butyrivibrio sp. YAB3001]
MLRGKTAVITGGSRGIGKAIATKYAENGANLAIVATRESEEALKTIEELKQYGTDVRLYACNIREAEAVEAIKEKILADFTKIDVLVNNAGVTKDNLLPSLSVMDIDDVIDINLKGTMFMTRAFIRNFVKNRNGNVINISSVVGLMGNKGQTNYAASKAGIVGFTKSVAKEYGRKNIRCNAIAPGYIETDMTDKLSEEAKKEISSNIPLCRLGKTEDVANLALFLASDSSGYITGEIIKVDGGMYV